jgi:hypothetical protein
MGRTFIFISSATGRHPPDKKPGGKTDTQLFLLLELLAKGKTISIKIGERTQVSLMLFPPFSPSSWIENHLKRKEEEVDSNLTTRKKKSSSNNTPSIF